MSRPKNDREWREVIDALDEARALIAFAHSDLNPQWGGPRMERMTETLACLHRANVYITAAMRGGQS